MDGFSGEVAHACLKPDARVRNHTTGNTLTENITKPDGRRVRMERRNSSCRHQRRHLPKQPLERSEGDRDNECRGRLLSYRNPIDVRLADRLGLAPCRMCGMATLGASTVALGMKLRHAALVDLPRVGLPGPAADDHVEAELARADRDIVLLVPREPHAENRRDESHDEKRGKELEGHDVGDVAEPSAVEFVNAKNCDHVSCPFRMVFDPCLVGAACLSQRQSLTRRQAGVGAATAGRPWRSEATAHLHKRRVLRRLCRCHGRARRGGCKRFMRDASRPARRPFPRARDKAREGMRGTITAPCRWALRGCLARPWEPRPAAGLGAQANGQSGGFR